MNLKTIKNDISKTSKKYTRLTITEDEPGTHTLIEKRNGIAEFQMGVGKYKNVTPRSFRILLRTVVREAKAHKIQYLAVQFNKTPFPQLELFDVPWVTATIAENLMLASYEYTAYKSKKPKHDLREVLVCGNFTKDEKEGFDRGKIIAYYTNLCRDLANTPGGDMTPALLANEVKKAAKELPVNVTVFDEKKIRQEGMGALLAVGGSAKDKPRFIILEYNGEKGLKERNKKSVPIVLVGKGITFDTGGLQIKPGMAMYEMHLDMSGGAAVIAAVLCAAKLGLKKDVIGLIPAAENAVGELAMRPGDVITSMSGKTIDVLHTDAEGRLVLADALYYATKYNPSLIIDVATLTGAALIALGQHASAVMTTDRELENALRDLGEKSGDYVSPLPLWDEYKQYIKGIHGDVANIHHQDSKYAGSILGGTFLQHFVGKHRWVHIDMAPRMTSVQSDKLAKGATGEPVRLLVHSIESL